MTFLYDLTEEMFDSVDEGHHALDELTLPEGYVTTIERQQRVGNRNDGEVKAVNRQCSCNGRRPHSGAGSGIAPLLHCMGSSRVTGCSFFTTITRQRRQAQPDQW